MKKWSILLFMVLAFVIAIGCNSSSSSESSTDSPKTSAVSIAWTANKEQGVNQSGGGYKVYYSRTSGFNTEIADSVDVPWASGTTTPVSTLLNLTSGTYYIKVIAYSAVNSSGSSSSSEITVTVP